MRFNGRSKTDEPGFQLAPMVDVIFILLAFFIATQIFARWEKDIEVQLPTAVSGKMPQRLPGEIVVNVRQDGTLVVNDQRLQEPDLASLLGRVVSLFPGQPVLIRADKRTPYQYVIGVIDLCRQTDVWNISFATATE